MYNSFVGINCILFFADSHNLPGCGRTILQMMASVFQGDADLWLWLLPAEMTYLSFRAEEGPEMSGEANHVKMLQMVDQGAVMFADNVLLAGKHMKLFIVLCRIVCVKLC